MNALSQKKTWKTPQLTILVRIDLGESVLQTCKYTTNPTGASQANNRCRVFSWSTLSCGACSTERAS